MNETYEGIKSLTSINSVRSLIANEACEKGLTSVFVFFHPPIASETGDHLIASETGDHLEKEKKKISNEKEDCGIFRDITG